MSVMLHPNALLYSFKISNILPFCSSFRDDEMITGRVLFSPKNAYLKVLSNGLSSSFGGRPKVFDCPEFKTYVRFAV